MIGRKPNGQLYSEYDRLLKSLKRNAHSDVVTRILVGDDLLQG